ncbi:unnamed protein product [Arabidopsis lyrata]|nr:unnamed protein product [Arabidopsis lyrata]
MHLFDLPTPLTGRVKSLKSGRGVRTDADSEKVILPTHCYFCSFGVK